MGIVGKIKSFGLPRLIILTFLIILLAASNYLGISQASLWSDILVRFGMNAILVLAMLPSIQSGIGINFNLPLGVVCGLVGALISMQFNFQGGFGFLVAIAVAIPLAVVAGFFYALLLNKVKGEEMTVGNYFGYSVVSFMCIIWLVAPFTHPELIWPMGGSGLRNNLAMENSFGNVLNAFMQFKIGELVIPTGLLLFFVLCALLVYAFEKTKLGNSMKVAGSSLQFATSNGINVDSKRILGMILSTCLAAVGIIVYSQSFGFLQLYNAPLYVAMPAAASILIGGATLKSAKISHVVIGTFLFQSLLVVALPVINVISAGSMAEIVRISISNGIILYALTRGGEEA
ncbi:MAG: ABC transporter permease [Tissierellia bacterium]|nr:ABC transporter permease [Tissierellia bacterium]